VLLELEADSDEDVVRHEVDEDLDEVERRMRRRSGKLLGSSIPVKLEKRSEMK
jgi:hypothetical protein